MKLLGDDCGVRVDGFDDGWCKEGKSLNGDVVQQEYGRGCERDRTENAAEYLLRIHLVQDFGRAYSLRLDSSDRQILLFLRQPFCCCRPIREREEGDQSQPAGDDSLDTENHPPGVEATKVVQFQNAGCKKPTEGLYSISMRLKQC